MSNVPEVTGARSSRQKTRKTSKWSSTWIYLLALLLGWCVITWYFSFSVHKSSTSNRNGNEFSNVVVPPRKTPTNVDLQQRKESGSLSSGDQHFLISYLTMTGQFQQEEQSSSDAQKAQEIFSKEMRRVQAWLLQTQKSPFLPLTAYLESPLPPYNDTQVPRLLSTHRLANKPQDLIQREYTTDTPQSCLDLPNAFPVMKPPTDKEEAETQNRKNDCPIHGDPFLPWIHDAFVSPSGTVVEIVAHNQRRCHTNPKQYFHRLQHLEPQVTIMQSVPVIREKATGNGAYRYRLASLQEAAANTDAVTETRFICHFHTQVLANNQEGDTLQTIPLGETLSVFPYNYEHANDRKRNSKPMLTRATSTSDDKTALHNEQVWNSLLHFQCPIPAHLQSLLLLQDNKSGIYVDVVPIRTYPRTEREGYFDRKARNMSIGSGSNMLFDPVLEWGIGNNSNQKHWLPTVEQSGRWANIPLCRIPATPESQQQGDKKDIQERDRQDRPNTDISSSDKKKHFLSACVWASATFTTRGSSDPDTSTSLRLIEWLTYQFEIAQFDHVYIYDNSPTDGATTLESVTRLFPSHQVTRIPWKHPVCNNKPPGSNNPGERSSQYAAEASCRIRYGPMTQWLAVLDTDEYLIPQQQKSHDKISLRQWLEQASIEHGDTKIWSFYQTRAIPNIRLMDAVASANHPQFQWKKRDNTTFLETYNCDRLQFPKPGWAWRAQKQIFQPSFVLMHFVHYSIVTRRLLEAPNEWSGLYKDRPPNERRVDERNQAFLLHAKTTSPKATEYWKKQCPVVTVDDTKPDRKGKDKKSNDCPVGIPYPPGAKEGATDAGGREYNCYPHEVVSEVVVPRLKELLPPLLQRYREIIKY